VSLWGDPSLHPDFSGIVEATLRHPGLELIVETSGVGWKPGLVEELASDYPERLSWIVSLDDSDNAGYMALRGSGQAEAFAFAESLVRFFPKSAHVQAVRMKSNEARLEGFWRHWREQTPNVIIQKYDDFAGLLDDRAVADLSPLVRMPCWHLGRDLVATMDGSVLMCREVLAPGAREESKVLGKLFEEPLAEIWVRGEALHRAHVERRYPAICERCDEYHTYNA
jgi:spiro-SPASM protein